MTLLSTKNVSFGVSKRLLVEKLSFDVEAGQCWGVLGPNGSGKTTLLHTLAGLLPLGSGELTIQDVPIDQLSRRRIAQNIGLLLQDSHDPFPATVWETVLSGRHPHLKRWQAEGEAGMEIARTALETMQLTGMEERQVQTLSGGERRRLAFATLLTQDSPLMLLDEPLNHLDLRHQQLLLQTVRSLSAIGYAIIMVLHDPNQAMHYCDRVVMLKGDGQWREGPVGEIMDAPRLSELYDCRIKATELQGSRWFYYL